MGHHQTGVYAGVGAAGSGNGRLAAEEQRDGFFETLLHRYAVGLPLPPVVLGAVVGEVYEVTVCLGFGHGPSIFFEVSVSVEARTVVREEFPALFGSDDAVFSLSWSPMSLRCAPSSWGYTVHSRVLRLRSRRR